MTRKLLNIDDLDFSKGDGLIPAIAQDSESLKVLTLAYVNREALEKTIETGYAHYFRRSFGRVMKKGETSGNVQEVEDILIDCDHDAILFLVKQTGPACHLGKETCFHNKVKYRNPKVERKTIT
ncbi:MAG: phosphoribosyl-AMP cyclohydrolase [Candidatus Bathyarchaeia archaeon]